MTRESSPKMTTATSTVTKTKASPIIALSRVPRTGSASTQNRSSVGFGAYPRVISVTAGAIAARIDLFRVPMSLSSGRWKRYAESKYPHEREALEFLRENLPDSDPVLLYSNFEFIADDGSVNEVDALVVTRAGLFLVEIKSRGGKIAGNRHTWSWEQEGRVLTIDSPLILANRKARKLGDLLERQKAFKESKRPYVEALVFCSDPSISIQLDRKSTRLNSSHLGI